MNASGRKVVVLGTGGTLAGSAANASDNVGYKAGQVGIAQLLEGIAPLRSLSIETEQIAQVDSKDMTVAIWRELALRCAHWLAQDEVAGVVVTHGTDTIEETAFFLQQVLDPARPLVLTCAMRPSTAISADGPRNIVDALAVANAPGARGVLVACAGVVHDPRAISKVHHYRLDPFSSGDWGAVGYVEEGVVRLARDWPEAALDPSLLLKLPQDPATWPRVEIVTSHAGAGGAIVDALVAQGVDGIVVAATGNGSVHEAMLPALLRARSAGVQVVRASRTAQGSIIPTPGDVLPASELSPVKARIELLLRLLG